ncbi:MAG: hypothetical protein ACOCRO_11570 [Halanaerobiales bacterium]
MDEVINKLRRMVYTAETLENKMIRLSWNIYDKMKVERNAIIYLTKGKKIDKFMAVPISLVLDKEGVMEIVDEKETMEWITDTLHGLYGNNIRIVLVKNTSFFYEYVDEGNKNMPEYSTRAIPINKPIGKTYYGYSRDTNTVYLVKPE